MRGPQHAGCHVDSADWRAPILLKAIEYGPDVLQKYSGARNVEASKDAGTNHLPDPFARPRLRPLGDEQPGCTARFFPFRTFSTPPRRFVGDLVAKRREGSRKILPDPQSNETRLERNEIDGLAYLTSDERLQRQIRR
jgi:hypothetical protein